MAPFPMSYALIGGGLCHVVSRKLLLVKMLWDKNCRGVSLITQELYLLIYVFRYLDLLYLYVSFLNTLVKVFHLVVALAIVLLMRYSAASTSYDADLDTFPRAALIVPALVLGVFMNKVKLVIEMCHSFSLYLEAVALIPQFVLLWKRQAYEGWVLAVTVLMGGERLLLTAAVLSDYKESKRDDPYIVIADIVHMVVFGVGLVVLIVQRLQLRKAAGLNEAASKPEFDEVWEAKQFKFADEEAANKAAQQQGQ